MPSVCLLTTFAQPQAGDNATLLAAAFTARGWQVHTAAVDGLRLGQATGQAAGITALLGNGEALDLGRVDLLWTLGFGRRAGFLDKMQLLAALPARVRQVTRPEAILLWHGKYGLAAQSELPHPPTWASPDAEELIRIARQQGGRFVLKPPGGSFGQGLVVADAGSQRLAWAARALTRQGHYCLLQRHLPAVAHGEWRILIAAGEVIAGYRRVAAGGRAAANLAQGGRAEACALPTAELDLARRTASWLEARQIGYAGIDIAGDQLLEVNIVNPGGLATLRELGGGDFTDAVVGAILAANPPPHS